MCQVSGVRRKLLDWHLEGIDILATAKVEKKKEAGRKRGCCSEDATLRSVALEVAPLQVTTKSKV